MPYRKTEIRSYRPEDEPLLFGLARRSFGARSGWDDRRTLAVLAEEQVFVAEIEHVPAGYVALEREGETVHIDQLLVSPEHEEEGVGRQLVAWAEGYAISVGARTLRIAVEPDNRHAIDFYARCGFVPVGQELLELTLPGTE